MNLHIAPDNVFTNAFINNLKECGNLANNHIVVRTNSKTLKHVHNAVPFAPLYTAAFDAHVGDLNQYDKVYIHQFSPLLYRWIARNDFRALNWAVWGADLYNLPFNQNKLYERFTLSRFVNKNFSFKELLYAAKVSLLHDRYKSTAYGKVTTVLTWMETEFGFAVNSIPALQAAHQFFFYENQLPYAALDQVANQDDAAEKTEVPTYILGNSSTPELNHIDAVIWMQENGVLADLKIPISYGDRRYADFLKKNLSFYSGGNIEFIERYMNIHEYAEMLNASDGLIMNSIRPQGYGNIFMMMYLGKPVFLNPRNFSTADLDKHGLRWEPLDKLKDFQRRKISENQSAILKLLSHDNVLNLYRTLFS